MSFLLKPVPDLEWPPAIESLRQGFAGQLNVYRVMAHHPDLLAAWAPLREQVVRKNSLSPRLQELVVLRTAHHGRSAYERAHHVKRGREAGLAAWEIEATGLADASSRFSGIEAEVIGTVDELHSQACISPARLQRLADRMEARQVLDLITLIGFYHVLAFVANTFDVPIDVPGGS